MSPAMEPAHLDVLSLIMKNSVSVLWDLNLICLVVELIALVSHIHITTYNIVIHLDHLTTLIQK